MADSIRRHERITDMKLGIGSYTFTWRIGVPGKPPARPMTALRLLQEAKTLGATVVQVCDNLPLTGLSPRELNEFSAFAQENQIAVELGTRGLQTENLLAYLVLAKRFAAPFVRVVVDTPDEQPTTQEAVARLGAVAARFADAGVKLAIENHDRFPSAALVEIVEALGRDRAGICLDTVNSLGALETPETVVKILAPYTLNLHAKDFTIERMNSQMGFIVAGCAVGRGRLNMPWLLGQLRAAGREVNAIIELWTPFGATLEETIARECAWAAESVRYLRSFIPD